MSTINEETLRQLSLPSIDRVLFYKRDEITTDLICCEIKAGEKVWTFNEELKGWEMLIDHLKALPGFNSDWFAEVSQPPFEISKTVAFER